MGKIRSEKRKLNVITKFGVFAAALLVTASVIYLYSPVIKTHAWGDNRTDVTAYEDVQVGVLIDSYIGIGVDKELLDMSALPESFISGTLDVYVVTNSYLGHTLTIEDKDADTSLKHQNDAITDEFVSVFEGTKTSNTMDSNNWGFSIDSNNYYSIPPFGISTLINKTESASPRNPGYDTKIVDFGAKVGMDISAGTYSDVVLFTAYVNTQDGNFYEWDEDEDELVRVPIYKLGGTTKNMQNFDCERVTIGQTVNSTDLRDGNVYSIGRLPDGKCWMRQNLRLVNYTLTPDDSDVETSFVLKNSNPDDFITGDDSTDIPLHHNAVYLDSTNGAYYSLYTASAGTLDSETHDSDAPHSFILSSSLCPNGWNMISAYDFDQLKSVINGDDDEPPRSRSAESNGIPYDYSLLNLTLSGSFEEGHIVDNNEAGSLWTTDGTYAFDSFPTVRAKIIETNTVSSDTVYENVFGQGLPVRCVTGNALPRSNGGEEIIK